MSGRPSGGRFGSAASMFPFGSPINNSRRSILSPGALPQSAGSPPAVGQRTSSAPASSASFAGTGEPSSSGGGGSGTPHVLRGKVRAQDVYGGPLAFGGTPSRSRKSLLDNGSSRSFNADYSMFTGGAAGNGLAEVPASSPGLGGVPPPPPPGGSFRKSRLMFSASPYHSAASARLAQRPKPPGTTSSNNPSVLPRSNTPSPSSCASSGTGSSTGFAAGVDGMSSTARLILDTLDKMSTPLRDAQKILPFEERSSSLLHQRSPGSSRAEKRKLIAEQLNLPQSSPSARTPKRRRPNLGGGGLMGSDPLGSLRGPPTRSTAFMSPTPARPGGAKKAPPPQPMTKLDKAPPPPPPQQSGAEETVAVSSQHKPSPAKVSNSEQSMNKAATFGGSLFRQLAPPQSTPLEMSGSSGFGGGGGGGGKMKSALSKSNLRASAPRPEAAQPTPLSPVGSGFTPPKVSTMPSFNFGLGSQSSSPAPIAGKISLSSTFSTSSSKQFIFSPPEKVNSGNVAASATSQQKFVFSLPDKVKSQSSSASPLRRGGGVLPDLMASSGPSSSRTSSSSNMPVMKMPSSSTLQAIPTSSKLKSGSVMDFLGSAGSRGKLPDVTSIGQSSSSNLFGGAGIKPATQLKTGSVMSILGKSSNEPTWDPKFKNTGGQPWQ